MANDRLYLRCRQCGEKLFLSKHFINPWAIDERQVPEINEFFDKHCWCENVSPKERKTYFNSFDLVTEMGEGFPEEDDPILMKYYDMPRYAHTPDFKKNPEREAALQAEIQYSNIIDGKE